MASPLHKVIDAGRWDAEPPLGRLVIVVHAASLMEPTFMSLPDDVKVAIVGRLTDGNDLARVECTCTELRRLIADHDDVLWKPRFEALTQSVPSFFLPDDDDDNDGAADDDNDDDDDGAGAGETEVRSWKARYISWRDRFSFSFIRFRARPLRHATLGLGSFGSLFMPPSDWLLPSPGQTADAVPSHGRCFYYSRSSLFEPFHYVTTTPILIMPPSDWLLPSHGQTTDAVPGRMRIREKKRGTSMPGHGRSRTVASDGYRKKQHGAGAIHSPSSRYRWKHR